MNLRWPQTTPLLAALLAPIVLSTCREPAAATDPDESTSLRDTPHITVVAALAALERHDYGQFPALVGLALTLKPHAARNTAEKAALLLDDDFEKVRGVLRAAKDTTPRIFEGGRVAAYKLSGHGLRKDELHLIRLREQWFFIVD